MGKNNNHDSDPTSLNLPLVAAEQSGDGLPYAPINFPEQGDVWGWKAGKRLQPNGSFQDRYLYLPKRLRSGYNGKDQHPFRSKLSVERYIKSTFPDVNVDAFFASFTWRIPSVAKGLPDHGTDPEQVTMTGLPDHGTDPEQVTMTGLPDHGTDPEQVTMTGSPDHSTDLGQVTMTGSPSQVILREEYHSQILNMEAEVEDTIVALRKSQELECKVAKERLHEQQIYIQNLYKQLQCVVTELECPNLTHSEPLFRAIREKKEQIKREKEKFKEMKMVASGFGRISRDVLKEHFTYE